MPNNFVVPGLPLNVEEPDYKALFVRYRARCRKLESIIYQAMRANYPCALTYVSSSKVQEILAKAGKEQQ